MVKENPSLKPVRQHLKDLIRAYEEAFWSDEESITEEQIEASDKASKLVALENKFIQRRNT